MNLEPEPYGTEAELTESGVFTLKIFDYCKDTVKCEIDFEYEILDDFAFFISFNGRNVKSISKEFERQFEEFLFDEGRRSGVSFEGKYL